MPHFITTTHREGCDMCKAYALHVIETSKAPTVEILPREVKQAFQNAWPNIVHHIEDEAPSELDKKAEWYSNCHDNLTNDIRMVENKASAEWDHHQKVDEKLAQANSLPEWSQYVSTGMAVYGWEPQLHVPNGTKGRTRISQSSIGSAKTLASPLNVSQRSSNCSPDGHQKTPPTVRHGMRLQSMQLQSRSCDLPHIQPRQ